MIDEREEQTLNNPDFFVQPGDVAMLVRAAHWHNHLRICQVVQRLPDLCGDSNKVWWLCEFARPVRTSLGWMYFACLLDGDLRRVSLPVQRFRYPSYHYALLPMLANALSGTHEYQQASA